MKNEVPDKSEGGNDDGGGGGDSGGKCRSPNR